MGGGKSPMAFLTLGAQVTVGKDKQYVNSFKERSKQSPRLGMSKLSGSSVDEFRWIASGKPESRDGNGKETEDTEPRS